jgi:hypothetical protein
MVVVVVVVVVVRPRWDKGWMVTGGGGRGRVASATLDTSGHGGRALSCSLGCLIYTSHNET